jgi:hypothetical protein
VEGWLLLELQVAEQQAKLEELVELVLEVPME